MSSSLLRVRLSKNLHQSWILLIFLLGIILGIILAYFDFVQLSFHPVYLLLIFLLLIFNFLLPKTYLAILALSAGSLLGALRTTSFNVSADYLQNISGHTVTVIGQVMDDPERDGSEISLRLNHLSINGDSISGTIFARLSGSYDISRSDYIELKGILSDSFGTFAATMWQPQLISLAHPQPPDFALQLREAFSNQISRFIAEPNLGLALGYLLGQRSNLPNDLSLSLQTVGLTHIIVASGYNLSVLVRLSRRIFMPVSRFAAAFFGFLLIFAFISVTGLSPSMLRAGLVAGLSLIFWYFGRRFHPAKLLVFAAAISLLCNPYYLQDLGWLLSFASFIGIMLLSPLLTRYFYAFEEPNFVAATLIETLSAQICCLPITMFSFGSFSILSILANILILPTIPFVMLLTFVTGCLAFFPQIASLIGQLAQFMLSYHLTVVDYFSKIDWAIFSIMPGNPVVFLLYLPVLASSLYIWRHTKYSFRPRKALLQFDKNIKKYDTIVKYEDSG